MKVTGQYLARKVYSNNVHFVMLKIDDKKQADLLDTLFKRKAERDARAGHESLLNVSFNLQYREKSYKQLRTVFALVTAIFISMDGRLPTEEEKYALYLDLLDVYALKTPSKIKPDTLRTIHLSESNTFEAAHFINGLMLHLATECDLDLDLQSDVKNLLWEWELHRGGEEKDPLDYYDTECTQLISEADWRELHQYSEASGLHEAIHLHHIVTRGANAAAIDKAWNWCALTSDEHEQLHHYGEKAFLKKYPHLEGKFKRAHRMAGKL
ncbi:hypothetical protein DWQ65_11140 [Treponema phagedenis]|uniref:Uncharacterized protein n=1 Tax=Treponema phagedenis TaxID=162 RepID=A0A0B7GZG2_TREPH|nr:hypothetical protein [Treponema phagedenis]EFW38627.1 hypothetical protein HMPREF9554_00866 [Treponema phagedenis F0421]NVP23533.1 hypothetical protein [Treponema phagedenis]NVP23765.1 hypothetical protein [Treponema phagedenis]QEJ94630.1 hypothetical protein FUT79_05040 [Treponema phagedenis]QEJ95166.1 hypothetical protein FUT79_08115 [Treponema phagedenis]